MTTFGKAASSRLARPRCRTVCLAGTTTRRPPGRRMALRRCPSFQTLLERVHQADDIAWPLLGLRCLDRLSGGLAPDPRLQRGLVFVLELAGIEMRGLGVEDMARQFDHVLGDLRAFYAAEILLLVAYLVGIPQRD